MARLRLKKSSIEKTSIEKTSIKYNILFEKKIDNHISDVPNIIPNRLEKIFPLLHVSKSELSSDLDIQMPYLNSVFKNKATFSGKTTFKLLKKYNLSFKLVYYVEEFDQELDNEHMFNLILVINTKDNKLEELSENEHIKLIYDILKKYENDEKVVILPLIVFSKILKEKDKLNLKLTDEDVLNAGQKNIKLCLESLNGSDINRDLITDNCYFFSAKIKKIEKEKIKIKQENLDANLTKLMFELPYRKVTSESILLSDAKFNSNNELILDKENEVLTHNGAMNINLVKPEDYILTKSSVKYYLYKEDKVINKLKAYRLIKKLSADEMSEKLGITKETYRLIEQGRQMLSTHIMWRIETKLNVLLESILDIDSYYELFCKEE